MNKKTLMIMMALSLTLVFVIAGCAGVTEQEPTAAPTETAAPEATEDVNQTLEREQILTTVQADLAERLGIEQDEIEVVSVESKNWDDTSLGCPEEGEMYAQVITKGLQIILEAEGEQYDYRTDMMGAFKLCQE